MSLRDILIILLVLICISFFFPGHVPWVLSGPIGLVLLIVLIVVLVRNTRGDLP